MQLSLDVHWRVIFSSPSPLTSLLVSSIEGSSISRIPLRIELDASLACGSFDVRPPGRRRIPWLAIAFHLAANDIQHHSFCVVALPVVAYHKVKTSLASAHLLPVSPSDIHSTLSDLVAPKYPIAPSCNGGPLYFSWCWWWHPGSVSYKATPGLPCGINWTHPCEYTAGGKALKRWD